MSNHMIIESTNKSDSPADIEDKLEKAISVIQEQRENKQFSDFFLKERKDRADEIVHKTFESMINQISKVLKAG